MSEGIITDYVLDLDKFEYKVNQALKDYPINIFPEKIENLIIRLHDAVGFEKSVTASTMLFVVSTIIGNSKNIKIKNTWIDTPNLWIAIVGKRGTMKTPTINFPIKALQKDELEYAEAYTKEIESYNRLDSDQQKKEQKPRRKQRLTTDITAEALVKLLSENPNGIGIIKDELNGLFQEMGRYGGAGLLEFLLSAFSGGQYIKNRATQDSITVDNIFLSIIGTIQPQVLKAMATNNTDNGFIDRWLYVKSENKIPEFTFDDIDPMFIDDYYRFIRDVKNMVSKETELMRWNPKALSEFKDCINKIRHKMRSEETPLQLSSYLAKIETYFARFCLLIPIMNGRIEIERNDVLKAHKLAMYYTDTANNTFIEFDNQEEIRAIYKREGATTKTSKIIALRKHLPEMTITAIAEEVGTYRTYASKIIKEMK